MIIVAKCRKHGNLSEEDCYYSESKNLEKGFRYRCKKCYELYNLKKSLEKKEQTKEKIKDWKKRNREKINEQVKLDRKKNPDKYREWQKKYREKYGDILDDKATARRFKITLDDYYNLIEYQKNKCAICNQEETRMINGKFVRLCIDHDHKSGKIRALLCHNCNIGLGKFEDNIQTLQSAIKYLNKHKEK